MSFQGDVAGIGLAELLQSLARSDREGILTLYSTGLQCTLGVLGGQLYFLAPPGEDPEVWRAACQNAWADDPRPHHENERRGAIARAHRMESLYRLLDAANLHFRFEPGEVALPQNAQQNPTGQGIAVESMLLEHARMSDEAQRSTGLALTPNDLPRALDAEAAAGSPFTKLCDGNLTFGEIADRLGWPLRHAYSLARNQIEQGGLRLAQARELLVAAQRELELERPARAAARLTAWTLRTVPGPASPGDAELLLNEWAAGRLSQALPCMEPKSARRLLRQVDLSQQDSDEAVLRWDALYAAHRGDSIIAIRAIAVRYFAGLALEPAQFTELLRLARAFQEKGLNTRTATVLRLASHEPPEKMSARVELGTRMLDVGMQEEGTTLLLSAARELIKQGQLDKAGVPLRAILKSDPDNRDANGLLLEARASTIRKSKRRWHSIVGLSLVLVLSMAALVQFRFQSIRENKLDLVRDQSSDPGKALSLLDEYFDDDVSAKVEALRQTLQHRKREEEQRQRDAWNDRFTEIMQECELGDPLLGLDRAVSLPPPPDLGDEEYTAWATRSELLNVLANRLENTSEDLDVPADASQQDLHAEARHGILLRDILDMIPEHSSEDDLQAFRFRVAKIHDELLSRRQRRQEERELLREREVMEQQDALLADARAHAEAGDFKRALSTYERLLALDDDESLAEILGPEVDLVRAHMDAGQRAIELATMGDHDGALRVLRRAEFPDLTKLLLPFHVTSEPSGARVRFGNQTKVTPFKWHTYFGERIELTFALPGCEPKRIAIDRPQDLVVRMHRTPDSAWDSSHQVEAAPVPVGEDHIVCDRFGRIARLAPDGRTRWHQELPSLGGVARTPVLLPSQPGHLLLLTEDGDAWLVSAHDGRLQGPWHAGSPPVEGPIATVQGVSVRFADGRVGIWTDGIEPELHRASALFGDLDDEAAPHGPDEIVPSSVAILQRGGGQGAPELASRWTDWTVRVTDAEYVVERRGDALQRFTVAREGQWIYLAWEEPHALIPEGRLWISDEFGLRSFLPNRGPLVAVAD